MPAVWGRLSHATSVWREYRRLAIAFDVVEAPELYAEGLFFALRAKVPLVIRMHSGAAQLFSLIGRTGLDARATSALENAAVRRAQVVTSTAPFLEHAITELELDRAFCRAIIYPVRKRPAAPPPRDRSLVLFVGRLEKNKSPETLLRAASRVIAAVPSARFRFVGSDTAAPGIPSYRRWLHDLALELGVADAVEFAGSRSHEEVFEEMAGAAVCAFPSHWESFGLVAAEAASIGRPVVVSDIDGFRDYVEDGVTGRVAPVDDPDAWADALLAVLGDLERAGAMAARLRETISRRAAPDVVARLTLEAHEAAIGRWRAEHYGDGKND
jgi:glycosyltransferase involved in cell wall biosynthesis